MRWKICAKKHEKCDQVRGDSISPI